MSSDASSKTMRALLWIIASILVGFTGQAQSTPRSTQFKKVLRLNIREGSLERKWYVCNELDLLSSDTVLFQNVYLHSFCCDRSVLVMSGKDRLSIHHAQHCQEPPTDRIDQERQDLRFRCVTHNSRSHLVVYRGRTPLVSWKILEWHVMRGMEAEPVFISFRAVRVALDH